MKIPSLLLLSLLFCACNTDDPSLAVSAPGASGAGGSAGSGPAGSAGSGPAGSAGSGTAGAGGGGGGVGGSLACDGSLAAGVAIATTDPFHYPSYAIDGCRLLYLAPVAAGAELRLRDLTTGDDSLLAPSTDSPLRPSLAWPVAAWEATEGQRQVVRIWKDGVTTTAGSAFAQATEPRATGDAVVFTGWKGTDAGADSDVFLFHVDTGQQLTIAEGPGQQRFASVSPTHVAYTDFSEDPAGLFNPTNEMQLADIVLFDRATSQLQPHPLPGKQAFPLLGSSGHVVYLHWPSDRPEPKFQHYGIRDWPLAAPPAAEDLVLADIQGIGLVDYARPGTRDGLVEWVEDPNGVSSLHRADLFADATPKLVGGFSQKDLFFPLSAGPFSLIATRSAGASSAPVLSVLAH
jgi:hypothetical protein